MGYDVIVVGLGAMGSAAAAHLATRGQRVLGLDRFAPPHDRGSSHGRSRIIRQAYFEGPGYVPLVQRAYDLWHELERETGRRLLTRTGGLMIGRPEDDAVIGSLASAREHDLPHEVLEPGEVADRWPALRLRSGQVGVYEDVAGVLDPEACVMSHLEVAARHGAELRTGVTVDGWDARDARVSVATSLGSEDAERIVLAAGAWSPGLLGGAGLTVERQFVAWFRPPGATSRYGAGQLPLFFVDRGEDPALYAIPDIAGDGVKAAFHHGGVAVEPGDVPGVRDDEVTALGAALAHHLPRLGGTLRSATTCLYTNTPDEHFAIGPHPRHAGVTVVTGGSGHGFKFSAALGEVVADLILDGASRFDLTQFDPARLLPAATTST